MPRKFIERRRMGPIGMFVSIICWMANIFMATFFFAVAFAWNIVFEKNPVLEGNQGITVFLVLGLWAVVAVVSTALWLLTRGRKEIVEVETNP